MKKINQTNSLPIFLIIYCLASLLHFSHNAIFIDEYPNLPDWISASGVYITWLGITGIGITGYFLFRHGKQLLGLIICAIYGAIGLDGLGHYTLAPISAHSFMMNFSIWFEVITAIIVLITVTGLMVKHFKTLKHQF